MIDEDQSYCLNCGARLPGARTPFTPELELREARTVRSNSVPADSELRDWTPIVALGGLALLALMLIVGVLIGRNNTSTDKVAAGPQVIQLQGGANAAPTGSSAAGAGSASAGHTVASIASDWPSGRSGWTVEVATVKRSSATSASVNAAKVAAAQHGATKVGVIDPAKFNNLGSDYIIYSGSYSSQSAATTAVKALKKKIPGAKILHVVPSGGNGGGTVAIASPTSAAQQAAGAAAIQQLNNCSGAACSKAARKITQPIATPGTAPKKDNKPAGGGSAGQTFN